ncbi:SGNH/GDSL hydrolase family protein [Frondihabitans australicus]|uniref:Lysophospholipase L1-like esterase n=1 Tax=Frondihabitans australicus TaxID=386892 RepID=A0A495IF55_9MICO|nr:SGNH/GDSL hydrolase family protein [Frondihabitans australicus]RKR74623.1 lysophospholipase L1-like esterase [Frondihabitans australicus]
MTSRLRPAILLAAAALTVTLLAGCSTTTSAEPQAAGAGVHTADPAPASPDTSSVQDQSTKGTPENPVRVAIVGDSLTAGGSRTIPQDGLDKDTWMTYAQGDGVKWVGGWAMGGTTTQIEAYHVTPVKDVDVLVLMSGTNNVRLGISLAKAKKYYDYIVKVIHPKHVIIGAIPPYNRDPDGGATYEKQLKAWVLTKKKSWTFYDPWGPLRDGKYYVASLTADGIHPTAAGYRIVGHNFRDAILQEVSDTRQNG